MSKPAEQISKIEKILKLPENWFKKFSNFRKKHPVFNYTIIIVSAVLGFLIFKWQDVKHFIHSDHDNIMEQNYVNNDLLPFVTDSMARFQLGPIPLVIASNSKNVQMMDTKFALGCSGQPTDTSGATYAFNFKLQHDGNKVKISLQINDFESKQMVGQIVNNHWKLRNGLYSDYNPGDQYLEIFDNQNFPVFVLWVDKRKIIQIRGYFSNPYCTMFFLNDGQISISADDPHYKTNCFMLLNRLKHQFPNIETLKQQLVFNCLKPKNMFPTL